jgi:hypothetical protein
MKNAFNYLATNTGIVSDKKYPYTSQNGSVSEIINK